MNGNGILQMMDNRKSYLKGRQANLVNDLYEIGNTICVISLLILRKEFSNFFSRSEGLRGQGKRILCSLQYFI